MSSSSAPTHMSLEKHHQSVGLRPNAKKLTIVAGSSPRSQSSEESNVAAQLAFPQSLGPGTSKKLMPEKPKNPTETGIGSIFADHQEGPGVWSSMKNFLNSFPIDETSVFDVSNPCVEMVEEWGSGNSLLTEDSNTVFSNGTTSSQMLLVNPRDVESCNEITIGNAVQEPAQPVVAGQQLYYVEVVQPESVSNGIIPVVGGNLYCDLFGTSMNESLESPMDESEVQFKDDPELEHFDIVDLVTNDEIKYEDPRVQNLVACLNDEGMQAVRLQYTYGETPGSADLAINPAIPVALEEPPPDEETNQVVKRTRGRPRGGQNQPVSIKVPAAPK